MKKYNLFALLVGLLLIIPAFVSCDKDDDKNEPDDNNGTGVSNIIGTYKGSFDSVSVMGTSCDVAGEYDFIIKKMPNESDEVTVVLPECSYSVGPMGSEPRTIPSITVDDVDVSVKNSIYRISSNYEVEVDGVKYSGKIAGTIQDKKADIFYTVSPGKMGMSINFTYSGTLK